MNTLLIFFAFPIAVIIISAILQKILKNPITVAALIFAIFLVITFAFFDETFLIATLVYTVIAFLTAFVIKIFCRFSNENNDDNDNNNEENEGCGCRNIAYNNTTYRYNRYRRY